MNFTRDTPATPRHEHKISSALDGIPSVSVASGEDPESPVHASIVKTLGLSSVRERGAMVRFLGISVRTVDGGDCIPQMYLGVTSKCSEDTARGWGDMHASIAMTLEFLSLGISFGTVEGD